MANLDCLMKDLNAITQQNFEVQSSSLSSNQSSLILSSPPQFTDTRQPTELWTFVQHGETDPVKVVCRFCVVITKLERITVWSYCYQELKWGKQYCQKLEGCPNVCDCAECELMRIGELRLQTLDN